MKKILLMLCLMGLISSGHAQNYFEIGAGFSYDYGISVPRSDKYLPYTSGNVALYTFDGFIRIPVNKFISIIPAYFQSLPSRIIPLENLDGDYIPMGYDIALPYKDENQGFSYNHYGDDYDYFTAEADIRQKTYGAFLALQLVPGFDIGTGLFIRKKETRFYNLSAYDEYSYYSSTAELYDNYWYNDTYIYYDQSKNEQLNEKMLSIPLLININYGISDGVSWGFQFINWFSEDNYMSFRSSIGVAF